MPLTLVAIGLKPLVLLPGFGSKVSMWLGPPVIKSKMQLLCFGLPCEVSAACNASRFSQPEAGSDSAPRADNFNHSRRERELESMVTSFSPLPAGERGRG